MSKQVKHDIIEASFITGQICLINNILRTTRSLKDSDRLNTYNQLLNLLEYWQVQQKNKLAIIEEKYPHAKGIIKYD